MRLKYLSRDGKVDPQAVLPRLSISLDSGRKTIRTLALLDSGSAVNVLPYKIGIALGLTWDERIATLPLVGNLAQFPAQAVSVACFVQDFPPVALAFAWTKSDHPPLILGQENFFSYFDLCFFRATGEFEIQPRQA